MNLPKNIKSPIRVALELKPNDVRIVRVKKTGWVGSCGEELNFLSEEDLLNLKGFECWVGLSGKGYSEFLENFEKLKSRNPKLKILKITKE